MSPVSVSPGHKPEVMKWIDQQTDCLREWFRQSQKIFTTAICKRIISSYPWKDVETMNALASHVLFKVSLDSEAFYIDEILPPGLSLLSPSDVEIVVQDVTFYLGRVPQTTFEVYDAVYHMVTQSVLIVPGPTHELFCILFRQ